MGMSRRMEHYDTAAWQPYLIVAASRRGLYTVRPGLSCIVQIMPSAWAERGDNCVIVTGDPWGGRTLEWLTSSPPAPYNFAIVPEVRRSRRISGT